MPSESEEKNNMLELDITSDEAVAVWGGEVMITMEFNSIYNNLIFSGIVGWTKALNPVNRIIQNKNVR